jgi:hypothetical protein
MTNRVRITAGRIKVSRPGVDVDAATAGQLVFDTGSYVGARYLKEHMSGFYSVNNIVFPGGTLWNEQRDNVPNGVVAYDQVNYVNPATAAIPFGKTFSSPPKHFVCVVLYWDPVYNSYGSIPYQTFYDQYGQEYRIFSRTTTTNLLFSVRKVYKNTLTVVVPILGFAYVVYDQ